MNVSATDIGNFLFHPFHKDHAPCTSAASLVTLIALSILTCGIYTGIVLAVNLGQWAWEQQHPTTTSEISSPSVKIPLPLLPEQKKEIRSDSKELPSNEEEKKEKIIERASVDNQDIPDWQRTAIQKRVEENKKIEEFYKKHNIKKGNEPLHVDLDSLGLDLNNTTEITKLLIEGNNIQVKELTVTLGTAAEEVIQEINRLIQDKSLSNPQKSPQDNRNLLLDVNSPQSPACIYKSAGAPPERILTKDDEDTRWIPLIIHALIAKGHLYKLCGENGNGYFIQA